MSKPLSDDEKERVFGDIVKSIAYISDPAPGEFTVETVLEALKETGHETTRSKVFHRLTKLVEAGVLSKREIAGHGARTNVYFPLQDVDYEELVEILLES